MKNEELVVQNKSHSSKTCFNRNRYSKPLLVKKQSGIQLKSGSVFCLPAKSSHSSRIIIPNKRFLEDDYHGVEISPKKPKVEHSLTVAKKTSIVTVPSTYRCPLGSERKQVTPDNVVDNTGVRPDPHEPEVKENISSTKNQDLEVVITNSKAEVVSESVAEKDNLKNELTAKSIENTSTVMSSNSAVVSTGSVLQKPKLCLDQSAVDRSKLAFAKLLRNQIVQESESNDMSDPAHMENHECPLPRVGDTAKSEVCSSNSMPSVACVSWNSATGKCYKLYCCTSAHSNNLLIIFQFTTLH